MVVALVRIVSAWPVEIKSIANIATATLSANGLNAIAIRQIDHAWNFAFNCD